jgi:hypothetical protein
MDELLPGFAEFEKNAKFPHDKDTISIGYLDEVCEWIFNHPDIEKEDKLQRILALEKIIQGLLNGETLERPPLGIKCRYIPTWSPKLKNT